MLGARGSGVRACARRALGCVVVALSVVLPVTRVPAVGTFVRKIAGPHAHSGFGTSIAPIEDLDGDGVGDLIVSVPQRRDPVSAVLVLSGADGSTLRTFEGESNGDELGHALAVLHDMDGRGTPDVLAGAPGGGSDVGFYRTYAKVFAGEDGAVLFDSGDYPSPSEHGRAVARLGDLTGDGVDDFAVGQPWRAGVSGSPGVVLVHSGSDGSLVHELEGELNGQGFGSTIVPLSDVNGDGVSDFAVGSEDDRPGDGSSEGRLTVISGADFTSLRSWRGRSAFGLTIAGLESEAGSGRSIAIPFRRSLEVYDAATGARRRVRSTGSRMVVGTTMASVGDIDGDGAPEVVLVADIPGEVGATDSASLVEVHSTRSGRVLFSLRTLPGEAPTVSPAGDLDGDGVQELAVGFQTRNEVAIYKLGPAPAPTLLRIALQRVPGDTDPDARGVVEIGPRSPERPLWMEVLDMDAVPLIFAFLETAPGSGDFVDLGRLTNTTNLSDWTFNGVSRFFDLPDPIRFGTLQDFEGCRIEVRDQSGNAHLRAVITAGGVQNFSGGASLGCPEPETWPKARGSVRVSSRHRRGTAKLALRAVGLPQDTEPRAWIEDGVGSGTFVDVGALVRGRLVLDTARSDTLPGWVPDGPSLSGRILEVRDGATVLLGGVLP